MCRPNSLKGLFFFFFFDISVSKTFQLEALLELTKGPIIENIISMTDKLNCLLLTIQLYFQIFHEPVDFDWVEKGRIDSLEYADHVPSGGNVKVASHRVL